MQSAIPRHHALPRSVAFYKKSLPQCSKLIRDASSAMPAWVHWFWLRDRVTRTQKLRSFLMKINPELRSSLRNLEWTGFSFAYDSTADTSSASDFYFPGSFDFILPSPLRACCVMCVLNGESAYCLWFHELCLVSTCFIQQRRERVNKQCKNTR